MNHSIYYFSANDTPHATPNADNYPMPHNVVIETIPQPLRTIADSSKVSIQL